MTGLKRGKQSKYIRKWKSKLGLRGWKIDLMPPEDRPLPSSCVAYSEWNFDQKHGQIWADPDREDDIVHEMLHLFVGQLYDVFWKAAPNKKLRSLWKRREERIVRILEKVVLGK